MVLAELAAEHLAVKLRHAIDHLSSTVWKQSRFWKGNCVEGVWLGYEFQWRRRRDLNLLVPLVYDAKASRKVPPEPA